MAAYVNTFVFVLLVQALLVSSDTCKGKHSSFYCCGDCEDIDDTEWEVCVTSSGEYHHSTYDCGSTYQARPLTVGTIIGIVIGCFAGLGIVVSVCIYLYIKYCRILRCSRGRNVMRTGHMSVLSTTTTMHGHPVQGPNFPIYENNQIIYCSPSTSTSRVSNTAYAPEKHVYDTPPSYEQVSCADAK